VAPQPGTANQAALTRTYTNGQCTTSDIGVIYQPLGVSVTVPNPLPGTWTQAGRGAQDYIKALACAATFVEMYETFDYHQIHTLYEAIPLLSADAQKRFYEGDSTIGANIRTNVAWQKKLQQNKVIEVARVSVPDLLGSEYSQGVLYLTLDVPYTVVEQIDGQITTQSYNETVLLKSIAPDTQPGGIGWQVSDWNENA
jgi:hypothetical protein